MSDVRRSRHLVCYWQDGRLEILNYATGRVWRGQPLAIEILNRLGHWEDPEALVEELAPHRPEAVRELLRDLCEHTLVEAMSGPPDPAETAHDWWTGWNPAAGFFHHACRDVPYRSARSSPPRWPLVCERNYPEQIKGYPESDRVELPELRPESELARLLLERRTWRRFGDLPIALDDVATLLGLTWGVQRWMHLDGRKRVALKTSPSGGARHSLEVYLLAFAVHGLAPGTYHYDGDGHRLSVIAGAESWPSMEELVPAQSWFHRPAALFFMTSVFERVQWKYKFPRAYRTVLIEAGHFCQTFCLLATSLGLAPFCTGSIADAAVERHLRLDGVGEAVLYAAGVGSRPEGVDWAPAPPGDEVPATSPPAHVRRRQPGRGSRP